MSHLQPLLCVSKQMLLCALLKLCLARHVLTRAHALQPAVPELQRCISAAQPPHGVTERAWARLRLSVAGVFNLKRPLLHPLHRRVHLFDHVPGARTQVKSMSGGKVHKHMRCTVQILGQE